MPGTAALTVAVLCGGRSRRMGSDKRELLLDGASLLDRVLARITPIAATVILATGRQSLGRPGVISVHDAADGRGPLAGIVASLQASPHDLCAMVAADMPDVDADLLVALATRCGDRDAAVPVSDRGIEPLHAVYARSALGGLRAAMGSADHSMRGALLGLCVRYVDPKTLAAAGGFERNLNTPADVRAWLADREAWPPHR